MKRIILTALGLALAVAPVFAAVTVVGTEIDWSTAGTEARMLGRFAGTNNLALVYTDGFYSAYYIASSDLGSTWSGKNLISAGQFPSLALAWVSYTIPVDGHTAWSAFVPYYQLTGTGYDVYGATGWKENTPLPPLDWPNNRVHLSVINSQKRGWQFTFGGSYDKWLQYRHPGKRRLLLFKHLPDCI